MDRNLTDIILDSVKGTQYGVVNVALKYHAGELSTIDTVKWSTFNTPKGNTEAGAIVTALMKSIVDAQDTGHLTFNVHFVKGHATKVGVQDFKRISMKK